MPAAAIACSALVLIACVHLYWAAGGSRLKAGAVPFRDGRPVLSPGRSSTVFVALALLAAAALVGGAGGLLPALLPQALMRGACGLLAAVFAARAVGDLRYVGFFKRVRGSVFAARDDWVYSPLCVALAALIGAVAVGA